MAKDLSTATRIGSDANYLNGNLVDGQTLMDTTVFQDIVQFFQKLLNKAGLTENGNFDNEVNGYQFVEALDKRTEARAGSAIARMIDFNGALATLAINKASNFTFPYSETYNYAKFIGIVSFTRNAVNYVYGFDVTSSSANLAGGLSLSTTDGAATLTAYANNVTFNNTSVSFAVSNVLISIQILGHKV